MRILLTTPVQSLGSVGSKTAKSLERLGITTVADLLEYFPFRYQDYSRITPLSDAHIGDEVTLQATVISIENKRTAKRYLTVTEAHIGDDSGYMKVLWFNQPYLTKNLAPGTAIALAGKVTADKKTGEPALVSPVYEYLGAPSDMTHTGRVVPLYPLTEGITQKQLRFLIRQSLTAASDIQEFLPLSTREHNNLLPRSSSLRVLHFPPNEELLADARRSLQFEELLTIQLSSQRRARALQSHAAYPITHSPARRTALLKELPFELTDAQKKVLKELTHDIGERTPMNRLLQGDVGSGKTVVAALAMAQCAATKHQAVLMAPTELLAQQHFATLSAIFKNLIAKGSFDVALLTAHHALSNTYGEMSKVTLKNMLNAGDIGITIGTHALLTDDYMFNKLALIVIDEQHRFGVAQRKALREKNSNPAIDPHLLSLTATPIPRSLALTLYGDLELSILNEKPKNRQKIITKLVASDEGRQKSYQFIRQELRAGRQAFIVCPIIEESDILGVKAATQEYELLKKEVFITETVGLLHGQMKPKDKDAIMRTFKDGETAVLISTQVIEVGVDIPNATIMMIEASERFGLAQLHQLRGRVGRGADQSYCFLMATNNEPSALSRLQYVVDHDNGFELAEFDLKTRGAGQAYGAKQSGFLNSLKIADITDHEMIAHARAEAKRLLVESEDLSKFPHLARHVDTWERLQHWE